MEPPAAGPRDTPTSSSTTRGTPKPSVPPRTWRRCAPLGYGRATCPARARPQHTSPGFTGLRVEPGRPPARVLGGGARRGRPAPSSRSASRWSMPRGSAATNPASCPGRSRRPTCWPGSSRRSVSTSRLLARGPDRDGRHSRGLPSRGDARRARAAAQRRGGVRDDGQLHVDPRSRRASRVGGCGLLYVQRRACPDHHFASDDEVGRRIGGLPGSSGAGLWRSW